MTSLQIDKKAAKDIQDKLKKLDSKELKKISRKAIKKGGNVLKKKIVQNAKAIDDKKSTNAIWKNVAIRNRRNRKTGLVGIRIGVLGGAKEGVNKGIGRGGDTWYWRLLEFGTSKMRARPFFRPAIEDVGTQNSALNATKLEFEKVIMKI